jgi:hypothetical protein
MLCFRSVHPPLRSRLCSRLCSRLPITISCHFSQQASGEPSLFIDRLAKQLGLSSADKAKIIHRAPSFASVLRCKTAEPNMVLLREELGLSSQQLARIVVSQPTLLSMHAEQTMEPKLAWLRGRLGTSEEQTRKMMIALPRILGFSVGGNLEPTLSFLETRLQLSPDQLRAFVLRHPPMLGANTEGMAERLEFVQRRFELTDDELLQFLHRVPAVLMMHVANNLEPKIAFFEDVLGKEVAASWIVHGYPTALLCGLPRLSARTALLEALKVTPNTSLMALMCAKTDERFFGALRKRFVGGVGGGSEEEFERQLSSWLSERDREPESSVD